MYAHECCDSYIHWCQHNKPFPLSRRQIIFESTICWFTAAKVFKNQLKTKYAINPASQTFENSYLGTRKP